MQDYPHHYSARASAGPAGDVEIASPDLPTLRSGPPPQFGGPGGQWSPETFLVAAIVDCFVLTFRSIARASKMEWRDLQAEVEGRLEKVEGTTRFTAYTLKARLTVPPGTDAAKAKSLLKKAEHACLISNSLNAAVALEITIVEG